MTENRPPEPFSPPADPVSTEAISALKAAETRSEAHRPLMTETPSSPNSSSRTNVPNQTAVDDRLARRRGCRVFVFSSLLGGCLGVLLTLSVLYNLNNQTLFFTAGDSPLNQGLEEVKSQATEMDGRLTTLATSQAEQVARLTTAQAETNAAWATTQAQTNADLATSQAQTNAVFATTQAESLATLTANQAEQFADLATQQAVALATSQNQITLLQTDVDKIKGDFAGVLAASDSIDQFLQSMRELLLGLPGPLAASTPTLEPTPTVTATVSVTATIAPLLTTTPTPTATATIALTPVTTPTAVTTPKPTAVPSPTP